MKKTLEQVISEEFVILNEGELNIEDIYPSQSETDPIIQLKKRLDELETEWMRVVKTPIAFTTENSKEYNRARYEKRLMLAKIQHRITQNVFAIRLLTKICSPDFIPKKMEYKKSGKTRKH